MGRVPKMPSETKCFTLKGGGGNKICPIYNALVCLQNNEAGRDGASIRRIPRLSWKPREDTAHSQHIPHTRETQEARGGGKSGGWEEGVGGSHWQFWQRFKMVPLKGETDRDAEDQVWEKQNGVTMATAKAHRTQNTLESSVRTEAFSHGQRPSASDRAGKLE